MNLNVRFFLNSSDYLAAVVFINIMIHFFCRIKGHNLFSLLFTLEIVVSHSNCIGARSELYNTILAF